MKISLKKFLILFLSISLIFTYGCSNLSKTNETKANDKLTVAVSIPPEEAFVKAVAGNLVNVVTLIPPGKSPENTQPTPQTLQKFSNAKLYFTIGVPSEKESILPKAKSINKNIKIVNLFDETEKIYKPRKFGNSIDPHIWLSPKRTEVIIQSIKNSLCSLDPKNKEIYEENCVNYINKLKTLDINIKNKFKNKKNKSFIVYHPAFGYFADDYGLNMIALEKEGKDASPQDLQNLIDIAKKQNLNTIFYEEEVDSKQSRAFAESINGKAQKLSPLSQEYITNMQTMTNDIAKTLK